MAEVDATATGTYHAQVETFFIGVSRDFVHGWVYRISNAAFPSKPRVTEFGRFYFFAGMARSYTYKKIGYSLFFIGAGHACEN